MKSTAQPDLDPQAPLPTGPTHVASRSTQTRASNAARAALVVANVTPTGYRVGLFMANHARYATEADIRRNVVPGELFCYWPQAKIAADLGCSERQVRRGVRSYVKRERLTLGGGCDRAKHRMFGFYPSGLASYQASGLIQNHEKNHRITT